MEIIYTIIAWILIIAFIFILARLIFGSLKFIFKVSWSIFLLLVAAMMWQNYNPSDMIVSTFRFILAYM